MNVYKFTHDIHSQYTISGLCWFYQIKSSSHWNLSSLSLSVCEVLLALARHRLVPKGRICEFLPSIWQEKPHRLLETSFSLHLVHTLLKMSIFTVNSIWFNWVKLNWNCKVFVRDTCTFDPVVLIQSDFSLALRLVRLDHHIVSSWHSTVQLAFGPWSVHAGVGIPVGTGTSGNTRNKMINRIII